MDKPSEDVREAMALIVFLDLLRAVDPLFNLTDEFFSVLETWWAGKANKSVKERDGYLRLLVVLKKARDTLGVEWRQATVDLATTIDGPGVVGPRPHTGIPIGDIRAGQA